MRTALQIALCWVLTRLLLCIAIGFWCLPYINNVYSSCYRSLYTFRNRCYSFRVAWLAQKLNRLLGCCLPRVRVAAAQICRQDRSLLLRRLYLFCWYRWGYCRLIGLLWILRFPLLFRLLLVLAWLFWLLPYRRCPQQQHR